MQGKRRSTGVKAVLAAFAPAIFALTLFAAHAAAAQEKVLYSFSNSSGFTLPVAGVISDASGNLYGTAFYGGDNGVGMVFELSPSASGWKQTVLHSFNTDGIDGYWVTGGLILDASGNLYGTTEFGGASTCGVFLGCGTIFKLTPNVGGEWTETILYDFQGPDGWEVHAGLIVDAAGNLYGTTANGGAYNQGVVFELSPAAGGWTEKTLHDFTGGADGGVPYGKVLLDAAGNLYGMNSAGGGATPACRYGCGTVFELSPPSELSPSTSGTWSWKGLHDFGKRSGDGHYPQNGLIFDTRGNLYGSTLEGGGGQNRGIVFQLAPSAGGKWTEKTLHNFNQINQDGINPTGDLIFDAAGNLYGETLVGGSNGKGTVFELIPTAGEGWVETMLHNFSSQSTDGSNPTSGVILDSLGSVYGTTDSGGAFGEGTVFEIKR
ncbi:MAG TPA: choice-of-anchor tandem repeat GloVer-containing protein [Candidatus Sulfotelmatobacter sp.]|jgi:uncharacterized repeat protein (TIGR03803 family)